MTVEQLARALDNLIPPELSEPWDNDGKMIIPNPSKQVSRVLCALDCTTEAINAARVWGCNVIVTHHPLIFQPLESINSSDSVGKRVIECIKNDIAVISFHTRLDIIEGGVNDMLALTLGLNNAETFIPYGRIGDVEKQTFDEFAEKVANMLNLDAKSMPMVNASDTVSRVAVVSGSGKDEINAVLKAGADTFVTGEVMHNHMIDCKELGLNLICATHYATERIVIPVLAEIVKKVGAIADIFMFKPSQEFGHFYSNQLSYIDELEEN
ncbi:MAG: Nif3-like dinuclear metal center hexameric protein [Clostridia bacterium]|nr:Nif3-like dinuclear metal center hexameric protein [Clostridia bacterium]